MSLWATPELPRPAHLLFESVSDRGWPMWYMPPNPGGNPYQMLVAFDWVHESERWLAQDKASIPGMVPDGGELVEQNFERNAAFGFKDWRQLWGKEQGKRCLLLGAGPSLRESRTRIFKEAKKLNTFTLAMNKAIGIGDTDYFYAMDRRGHASWKVGGRPKTTFIGTSTVNRYAVANKYKDMYWGEHYILPRRAPVAPLATRMCISMTDAMFVAYKLGAKEIWLYGCDYALAGEGPVRGNLLQANIRYYFDTPAEAPNAMGMRQHKAVYPIRGINDKIAYSTWELICYAAYTTAMAIILTRGGVTVRNKTPSGILWETWDNGDNGIQHPLRLRAEKVLRPVG
jgi:hypothetical protein